MGFRNPITSAAAVDTGQPASAGIRMYQGSDATGVFGVIESRDGIAGDANMQIIDRANLVPQGGGYTQQGRTLKIRSGSANGVPTRPELDLNIEGLPGGGYGSIARLSAADGIVLSGPLSLTGDGALTSYTPTWTAANSAPAIGNGTLTGAYRAFGRLVFVEIYLQTGSTTAGGTGGFSFALPVAAVSGREQRLAASCFSASGNLVLAGFGAIPSAATKVMPWMPTSGSNDNCQQARSADGTGAAGTGVPTVAGAYPYTPGSTIVLTGFYEAATS